MTNIQQANNRRTTGEQQINDNKNNSTKFMTNIQQANNRRTTGEQQINDNKNNSTKFMTNISTGDSTGEQQANDRLITFIHNFIISQSCKYFQSISIIVCKIVDKILSINISDTFVNIYVTITYIFIKFRL